MSRKNATKFPVDSHDITNAKYMFATNLVGVRVETVRNKQSRVGMEEYVNIPEDFYKLNKFIMLMAYVMFVYGNVFMIPSAMKLKFVTVKQIKSQTYNNLNKSMNRVIKLYGEVV